MNNQNINMNQNYMGFNNWNGENKQMMNMNQIGNPLMNMQMPNMQMNMQFQMQNMPMNMQNFPINNLQMNNSQPQVTNQPSSFQKQNSMEDDKKSNIMQNGKYTCRFEIQIENDKDFQVARRLIGSKVYSINIGM